MKHNDQYHNAGVWLDKASPLVIADTFGKVNSNYTIRDISLLPAPRSLKDIVRSHATTRSYRIQS
jgi:hypothetical protein